MTPDLVARHFVTTGAGAPGLDHQALKAFNPQRYPLALVDRIVSLDPTAGRAVAIKAVTATEACFEDIPDDAPFEAMAYPASLMIESFCQTAGPLCAALGVVDCRSEVMLLASISEVDFLGEVFPGEVMTHEVWITKTFEAAVFVAGETRVDGRICVRYGQIVVTWRPSDGDEI